MSKEHVLFMLGSWFFGSDFVLFWVCSASAMEPVCEKLCVTWTCRIPQRPQVQSQPKQFKKRSVRYINQSSVPIRSDSQAVYCCYHSCIRVLLHDDVRQALWRYCFSLHIDIRCKMTSSHHLTTISTYYENKLDQYFSLSILKVSKPI